jgi:hypothetical protein
MRTARRLSATAKPAALRDLAVEVLQLRELQRKGDFALFVPEVNGVRPSVGPGAPNDAANDTHGPNH